MKKETIQIVAYLTIIIIGCGWLLRVGSNIILPFLFSCLLAIFLIPTVKWFQRKVKLLWLSIILAFVTFLIPMALLFILFSYQLMDIISNIPSITDRVNQGIDVILKRIDSSILLKKYDATKIITDNIGKITTGPIRFITSSISSTSGIILNSALALLYTYFILYYKGSIKNFIIAQYKKYKQEDIKDAIMEIKDTVQGYVIGLGLVIIILTILNSLGLWIIGIDYPLFWGALAGMLAVIPYIGTIIGGLLPFLYALATSDYSWQPFAIVIYYFIIQQIEGNFITPNVIGNKVNINPFVAILSLVFFGTFWGIGGVIIALPIASVIRIIFNQFERTHPLAMLMSADVKDHENDFIDSAKAYDP